LSAQIARRTRRIRGGYLREVGILYANRRLECEIAEFVAEAPVPTGKVAASERGHGGGISGRRLGEGSKATDFSPSQNLRNSSEMSSDRSSRQCHDEADRALRNKLMAEANLAYRLGDAVH